MSHLNVVHLRDTRAEGWRNGGGVTHTLAAWPHRDDWQLRVSVAAIDHSGSFSSFPGVVRWFAVIGGAGVRLALPGGEQTVLRDDEPIAFDGEAAPMCHLLEGPSRDLNLMVRRDAGTARMWRAQPGDSLDGPTRWRGLYAAGRALLDVDGVTESLADGTLVWTDDQGASCWQLSHASSGPAWFLTLEW